MNYYSSSRSTDSIDYQVLETLNSEGNYFSQKKVSKLGLECNANFGYQQVVDDETGTEVMGQRMWDRGAKQLKSQMLWDCDSATEVLSENNDEKKDKEQLSAKYNNLGGITAQR